MLRFRALADGNRRHAGEVRARDAGEHAGQREGAAPVHAAHACVGVGASHDDRVHHPGPDDVVHEPPAADEQARILEPLDRSADEFHSEWPDYTISAGTIHMNGRPSRRS